MRNLTFTETNAVAGATGTEIILGSGLAGAVVGGLTGALCLGISATGPIAGMANVMGIAIGSPIDAC